MKQRAITKKATLSLEDENDLDAIGIVSPEKDYRFCFKINKALGWNLTKTATLKIYRSQEKIHSEAAAYIYKPAEMPFTLYLAKNRQDDFFILPKLKQADYILFAMPAPPEPYMADLKNALMGLPIIQSTFAVPNLQLVNIDVE